ncbi:MAG: DEAD/DEAH box helicase, partial [Anaerolineae bacterium]|nr:DEAD/DEAH box helicase [Anaerolineae bacterium]
RMHRVLQADGGLLEATPWLTDAWVGRVLDEAPDAFDRAFDRWRELYRTATRQLLEAQAALVRARRSEDQEKATRLQQEAVHQRNLLLQVGVAREESDFYPYRYLASEGFLPGYNFPALPVRAWVPRGQGEFIPRPRFLAIREFAPGSIIYHEGAKWAVVGFQAPAGGLRERHRQQRLCHTCGAFADPSLDLCPACRTRFDAGNSLIAGLLEMSNVRTRRRERITSDEEERIRRGYLIETYYRFAPHPEDVTAPGTEEPGIRVQEADVVVGGNALFRLIYAPSATLLRVNHGWRGTRVAGFRVDLESGEVFLEDAPAQPSRHARPPEVVRLSVQDTQNPVSYTHL